MHKQKVIIIGGGLGGLICGATLAKNGYDVVILDKNKQIGGCLQSFAVQKHLFDSCVHYIGGLEKGNTLYRIFDYLEIIDQLELEPYPNEIVDAIFIGDNPIAYPIAQGYSLFKKQLLNFFPSEEAAIDAYIDKIRTTIEKFPLYKLKNGDVNLKFSVLDESLEKVLNDLISNEKLQHVLLGNSLLYAGDSNTTPFYLHALIVNSYIESSYKIKGSSAQIAKSLVNTIRKYNGEIIRKEEVISIHIEDKKISSIETYTNKYMGDIYIAAIHPKRIYEMLDTPLIKASTRNRILQYPNSISALMLNIVLQPQTQSYIPYNIYWNADHPLQMIATIKDRWPANYAIYFTKDAENPLFAESISILTYLPYTAFEDFKNSFNTKANSNDRGDLYKQFKETLALSLINKAEQHLPLLNANIASYSIATPLTFRDYMGTDDGSIYGTVANFNQPLQSLLSVNCKIDNLLFTGQNINIHGVLGVSITAINTCASILGIDNILQKLN